MTKIFSILTNMKIEFEKGKDLVIGDYFWDFLLIIYFIIGVWVIQPKLNKLI